MGQLPVTCGLFFSLGHSTIVIVVNVAIAISTDVYDRMQGVGEVGGIVGAAVSATFLFVVGLANSIILYRILRKRYRANKQRASTTTQPQDTEKQQFDDDISKPEEPQHNTLMMKLIGPIVTFVDRPWKMYPVGVLFGFGFDTASSIALLALSAIAKREPDGQRINPADIVILPLLFTVGMTLVDAIDSIVMLYSYAGFPDRSFAVFERRSAPPPLPQVTQRDKATTTAEKSEAGSGLNLAEVPRTSPIVQDGANIAVTDSEADADTDVAVSEPGEDESARRRTLRVKQNAMANLSILLTVMSILVAFTISLITTMGLIGDNCTQCQTAANAEDGGGLAGRWWRGWANANDHSGYIGAAIVGSFVFVVASWYGVRFLYRRKWQRTCNEASG